MRIATYAIVGTLAALWFGTSPDVHAHIIHLLGTHVPHLALTSTVMVLPTRQRGRKHVPAVTEQDYLAMVARIVDAVDSATEHERYAGMAWYPTYQAMCDARAQASGITPEQAYGVFAVFSPLTRPERNYRMLVQAITQGAHTVKTAWKANREKAHAILRCTGTRQAVSEHCTGQKVSAFYAALCGDADAVTIDRHMLALIYAIPVHEHTAPTRVQHRVCCHALRTASSILGITPRDTQAIAWVVWRARKGIIDTDMHTIFAHIAP